MILEHVRNFEDLSHQLNLVDGEIEGILDQKKKYDQDEGLFTWLDQVPQKRWNALKGAIQVMLEEPEAQKNLRI